MIPAGLVVGYHGCDRAVAQAVVRRERALHPSRNDYDWLGHGLYFWQNDPVRALEWATEQARRKASAIQRPAVIGATIELGHCFVAAQREHIRLLRRAYERLAELSKESGEKMPRNIGKGWANRKLDCVVFEMMHRLNESEQQTPFDTVLAYFLKFGVWRLAPRSGLAFDLWVPKRWRLRRAQHQTSNANRQTPNDDPAPFSQNLMRGTFL